MMVVDTRETIHALRERFKHSNSDTVRYDDDDFGTMIGAISE